MINPDSVGAPPLVSILLPTHNRPDYAELALRSALAQDYPNIEVVVSDNSDDERTAERFAPYAADYPQLRYLRIPSCAPLDNFQHCYRQARGDYVNFLMDDDLFHPSKISIMMNVMRTQTNVGIVTSHRQLIDANGTALQNTPEHLARAFETDTWIEGRALGAHMITAGNIIGEPTTVLFRRSDAGPRFGMYMGNQYNVSSDNGTWFNLLSRRDCVYLREALSYFRIHAGQDQRITRYQIMGHFESLQLLCDVWDQQYFMQTGPELRTQLGRRLTELTMLMAKLPGEALHDAFETDRALSLIRRASGLLMARA